MRDKFEVELLKFSLKNSIPIIAVCRGFQFVNSYFGGKLQKTKNHVKKNHKIIFKKKELSFNENEILTVNSFHNYKIESLAKNFISIANSNDDSIEMAYARKQKILGLMFHPERKNISQLKINQLVFKYFKI
ncbi:gamma-glutamyl-gamma-aminobutyrate hydrolase family protein [Candidatus Pelagibacter bacterium nBUS_49]|uniref:gamma-glutamyl-gamma-aminobutyrate hydrolase family protein n=1 Tax=Candidatus Pelagibacter bacterium nBUS_49 TaxID=3374196 RepID=UPI003EBE7409